MSKLTERLIQMAAITIILWFGWGLARDSVINQITANSNTAQALQRLQACEAKK